MPRPRRNPFDAVVGVAGFLFVLTAASYCVTVLRGVRPAGAVAAGQSFDRLMAAYGTTALVVELAILAVGTFLSIAVDEMGGRETRRPPTERRDPAARADAAGGGPTEERP
jgi:hypothetical protein